jgi:rhodanese-related sulfurtransferase
MRFLRLPVLIVSASTLGLLWNGLSGRGLGLDRHVLLREGDELIDVKEARRWLDNGALFIDARARIAYEFGAIPGAIQLPENEFDAVFPQLTRQLRKQLYIVVYCDGFGCQSSHHVAQKLKARGIPASILDGGYPAWKEAGYPMHVEGSE